MKIDVLTLFPDMFKGILNESMIKIALKKKLVEINIHNLRKWANDKHKTADDKPYGGGAGMVIKVEPVFKALVDIVGKNKIKALLNKIKHSSSIKIILLTPKGITYEQNVAKKLSKLKQIILVCGHYEGFDERIRNFVTDEISVGDYIMTGGEIPAMAIIDSVTRLIPGVLGGSTSTKYESFENNLLEHPHYTRPREFESMKVPNVLLSGDHKKIFDWREKEAMKSTKKRRKDLFKKNREEKK
jgi:tRNA (guanine37-N1)-methyltransferase